MRDEPILPNKNRLLQRSARPANRKLFDTARRATFLDWFAATCNVRLSAAKAGVAYQTVFKHRMKDAAFAEAWDAALAQGYAYLEARLVQEARAAGVGAVAPDAEALAEAEERFDPALALTLLREHARRLPGAVGSAAKRNRTTARVASNEEVVAALTKRLKAFAVRVLVAPETTPLPSPSLAGAAGDGGG